ncbi:MAG TPA: hypothetical protein VLC94_00675 [Candidatus Acidoferrum sp.]|nr:hypothetical protein [Candidatus Acidoferrum sp.]
MPAKYPEPEHPFPAAPGTYWVYRGHVRWTKSGTDQVAEAPITWRTEIRKVIPHGDFLGIVVNGFPFDTAWADDHATPSDSLLVESKGRLYFVGDQRFQQAVQRLEQPSDSLDGLFSDDDLILEWPLATGQKFGDPSGMARTDGHYCWVVSSLEKTALPGVRGAGSRDHDQLVLEYWTNPDNTRFAFVPGVGITRYEYHHHGTVADTNLELVEFHLASGGRN